MKLLIKLAIPLLGGMAFIGLVLAGHDEFAVLAIFVAYSVLLGCEYKGWA